MPRHRNKPCRRPAVVWFVLLGFCSGIALLTSFLLDSFDESIYRQRDLNHILPPETVKNSTEHQSLQRLTDENAKLKQQLLLQHGNRTNQSSFDNSERQSSHFLCQYLSFPTPTADALWTQHIEHILSKSQLLPNDRQYYFFDFTAQLLQIVTPRLSRSVQAVSTDRKAVQHAMDVAVDRHRYLQNPTSLPYARPVRILVLGGSVLVGVNCRKLVSDLRMTGIGMPRRECTWNNRLDNLLKQLFGDVVQVTKVALGGTNTAVGTTLMEYDLIPDEAKEPDIVINAYSTNDMHVLTAMEAAATNQTLRDRVFVMIQDFVRSVLETRPCRRRPLLLHLDDYLGNEQREILATMELTQSVTALAQYYGFGSISYANVVRDMVYRDTHETWFSPEGWWKKGDVMEREIHPGMGMHIVTAWVIAYNLLHSVTTFCSTDVWHDADTGSYNHSFLGRVQPLRKSWRVEAGGRPRTTGSHFGHLPPSLNPNLTLDVVSSLWANSTAQTERQMRDWNCSLHRNTDCIFSWVGGLSGLSTGQQNNYTWIMELFRERSRRWVGWTLSNEGNKLGLVPGNVGDVVELFFENLPTRVASITLFVLRSYGTRWEGSQLRVTTARKDAGSSAWMEGAPNHLSGHHEKNTSEIYTELIQLPAETSVGGSLRIEFAFIGPNATTFKITGVAVC